MQTPPLAAPGRFAAHLLPVISPTGVTRLPPVLVLSYVVATFVLFLIWPIDWPIYRVEERARLIFYVTLCLSVIASASWAGSAGETRVTAPLPLLAPILVVGAAAAVVLLTPTSLVYTGRPPWDVLNALGDQGGAYKRLQAQLAATAGQRLDIALLRAALAPIIYAVLPLGVLHWGVIGWRGRFAVIVAAACSVVFSVMRGTDKELADLFVIGGSALLVSYGRSWTKGARGSHLMRRYWRWALAAIVFVYVAQGLYTQRKDERLNAGRSVRVSVCANNSHICADIDNPWIAWLPERERFAASLFILSAGSGYYGLNLALEKPFQSAHGVGHSPVALNLYEAITNDPTPRLRTYTYRIGDEGWSDDYYWSTLATWIANDVGFPGAVLALGVIGYLWGKWWREAAAGMSDPAAVLFALTTSMIVYFPANNQVFLLADGYTVFAVWIAVWLWHRARFRLSLAIHAAPTVQP